jgi:hypothetical protein
MENTKEFTEMLADNMQGVFLLTPDEIEKIIGKRAFHSFEKGILEPMRESDSSESEIFYEFVDVFERQFYLLDKSEKESYVKVSLERGKPHFLKKYFHNELVKLAGFIDNNDLGHNKNIDKVESLCKKMRNKDKKDIDPKMISSALELDTKTLIFNEEKLNQLIEDFF